MTSIINRNSLTEEFMLIYVKMWSPKLLPAIYEKFKSLFSVKCNTKSLGKGQGKRIQHFIQHCWIMFDEMLDENIVRLHFPSNSSSNIPTFPLTISFTWPQSQKSLIIYFYYLIPHPRMKEI